MKKTITVDRIQVTYTEIDGSIPTAVLVHGAGANRNYWKALCDVMGGRHLLCPDLYGHGETPPWNSVTRNTPAYSYRDDVPLIEGVCSQQAPPFDLVGHSSGGAVCLEYARAFPDRVRRMVLIEPMLPAVIKDFDSVAWAEVSSAYETVHAMVRNGQLEEAARNLFEYILGDGQWGLIPEKIRAWMTQNVKTTLTAHSAASLSIPTKPSEYAELRVPTLFIHGARTRNPYKRITQYLSRLLKGSKLEEIPDASHNSPLTHAAQINGLISAFLKQS